MLTRKGKIFAYIFIGIFLATLISSFVYIFVLAEGRFTNKLIESLPNDSELISIHSSSGALDSEKYLIEFIAVALFESDLTEEELKEYYLNYTFEEARGIFNSPEKTLVATHIEQVKELPIITPFTNSNTEYYLFNNIELESYDNIYYIAIIDYSRLY